VLVVLKGRLSFKTLPQCPVRITVSMWPCQFLLPLWGLDDRRCLNNNSPAEIRVRFPDRAPPHPFCMPADRPAPPFVLTSTPMCSQHARACCACSGKAVRVHFVGVAAKRRRDTTKRKAPSFSKLFSFTAASLPLPGFRPLILVNHVTGSAQRGAVARMRARAGEREHAGGRVQRGESSS